MKSVAQIGQEALDRENKSLKQKLIPVLGFIQSPEITDDMIVTRARNLRDGQCTLDNIKKALLEDYGQWNGKESGIAEENAVTVGEIIDLIDSLQ